MVHSNNLLDFAHEFKSSLKPNNNDHIATDLGAAHLLTAGGFHLIDTTIYGLLKLLLRIVQFSLLFLQDFTNELLNFLMNLSIELGLFLYDILVAVLNLVLSVSSSWLAHISISQLIPRTNYWNGNMPENPDDVDLMFEFY